MKLIVIELPSAAFHQVVWAHCLSGCLPTCGEFVQFASVESDAPLANADD
jgi:hypothetical protein